MNIETVTRECGGFLCNTRDIDSVLYKAYYCINKVVRLERGDVVV